MGVRRSETRWSLWRFAPLALASAAALILAICWPQHAALTVLLAIAVAVTLLRLYDIIQTEHSVLRNYPVTGHFRWLLESIRPQIRQYFIEADKEQTPFSRSQRSLVYARAKNEGSERAFGTQLDVYERGYEFVAHSTRPAQRIRRLNERECAHGPCQRTK